MTVNTSTTGDPSVAPTLVIDDVRHFVNRVVQAPGGCWEWAGACRPAGYGNVRFNGAYMSAHRLSHILFIGPIKDGNHVCHSCDNPGCVNPKHLWQGTATANMQDASRKGRLSLSTAPRSRSCGVRNCNAKLDESKVRRIRSMSANGDSFRHIATVFGVSPNTIQMVVKRRTWRHVE